ncbi:MAG TPA: hypothetical protein VFB38_05935 [Chthonomonadaceae bacterium]|nr:hypothetical protein [Chthonomonadaceae bacterium]
MAHLAPGVAPADLLRADFKFLDERDTLRTTWADEQLILLPSVQSHAHEGHGIFNGRRYTNTSEDDVARALRLDPAAVKEARQSLIDEIADYADRALSGNPPAHLLTAREEPLLGMSTLRYLQVQAADVLRGLYLGGLRDKAEIRHEVEQQTGVQMGGGKCYLVDRNVMARLGLDGDKLAHGAWADKIAEFKQNGLIVGQDRKDDPNVIYQYIRYWPGPGASDDAAIVAAGFRWGVGVAVGVFLADAIDTLEKYVPVYSDQDARIAETIEGRFADLNLSREDARQLTLWAAALDTSDYQVPDSSLRHLLAVDRKVDLCAAESHLLTVMGVPCPTIGLGHERTSSHRFYDYVRKRMEGWIPA